MKFLNFYRTDLGLQNSDEVFRYLVGNLKPSNRLWSYFVNWDKVLDNVRDLEVALNTLNYLIGKDDFDYEFSHLLSENPRIVRVLPYLCVRDGQGSPKITILTSYEDGVLEYEEYDFTKKSLDDSDIRLYLKFMVETGLKELIQSKRIKNLVDYMIGVEAGIDSNGRKNRGGSAMENIVEQFVKKSCLETGFQYIKEANSERILDKFGIKIPVDKSSRRYDFVISNGIKLFIIETNFYSGGGSKLKSTAGEYRNLFDVLESKYPFIWVTDGEGWKTTHLPLRETFNHNDFIFNLSMLEFGAISSILTEEFGVV